MRLLAEWLDVSRAALYKSARREEHTRDLELRILDFTDCERSINKAIGGVKLHLLFTRDHPDIKIGRDRFLRVLRTNGRLLRRRRRYTAPAGRVEPGRMDLACGLAVTEPGRLWVHDDTEVITRDEKAHLALSTDTYGRLVRGYSLSRRADAAHVSRALEMALEGFVPGPLALIHHSDNGRIYTSRAYQQVLGNHARASYSPPGRPDRNPIAERINATFKREYLCDSAQKTFEQLAADLPGYIRHYNQRRPHMSCGNDTPQRVHELQAAPVKLWKQRPAKYPRQSDPEAPPDRDWTAK